MTRAFTWAAVLRLVACEAAPAAPETPDLSPVDAVPAIAAAVELPPAPPTPAPVEEPVTPRPPPDGFVDLALIVPDVCIYGGYYREDNFTGARLPGYGAPGGWMLAAPADGLVRVAGELKKAGYVLVIFDAYRPYRGTRAMVAWAERTGQQALLDNGYIARRSGHNHGHTVDLGLAEPGTCALVDMGTPFDTLDERSHTTNAEGEVLARRTVLKEAMQRQGFQSYWKEWWHFQYKMEGTKARDVPYGREEPDEGAWVEPEGWDLPGWAP